MTNNKNKVIERLRNRIKPENRIFVQKNMAISQQIADLLEAKGWSQKRFAEVLDKRESEVSKWLSGTHNLTLNSLAKMEAVLGSEIITTPREACQKYSTVKYVTLKVHAKPNREKRNIQFNDAPNLKISHNSFSESRAS